MRHYPLNGGKEPAERLVSHLFDTLIWKRASNITWLLMLLLLANHWRVNAQDLTSNDRFGSFRYHEVSSSHLEQQMDLIVKLPLGYDSNTRRYPLMVLPDAEVMMGVASDIPTLMAFEGHVKPMIVVGLSFQTYARWIAGRQVYLTPTANDSLNSGKAAAFIDFLEQEVLPLVKENYRVDETNTILYGHSFGGLLTLKALEVNPDLFTTYIASSPSLEWNNGDYLASLEELSKPQEQKLLYLSLGTSETATSVYFDRAVALLGKYDFIELSTEKLENESHMSAIGIALTHALRWVFGER